MHSKCQQPPLLIEQILQWILDKIKANTVPILTSLTTGFLAYMYSFTNKLVNHDEVSSLFTKGATVTSGRWGLGFLDCIFPNYSMPWIYGVITLILITAAICVIIHIFSVQNKLLQALLAGSIMVFPSLIGTFGYMFTSSSYALSFFLAVLSVWFLTRRETYSALPALACLILSLSIYQSYISVAASLLVLFLIRQLLLEEDAVHVLLKGMYYVAFLLISLALYFIATQIVLRIKNVELSSYADNSITLSLSAIPSTILLAYSNFFRFFTEGYHSLIPTSFSRILHFACLIAAGGLLMLRLCRWKTTSVSSVLLLALLIAVLPLAINCMYLITSSESIHTLVLYSFISVYILFVILADLSLPSITLKQHFQRLVLNVIPLAMALIIVCNIYIANQSYLNMHLRYENAYAFYTSLIADIKMTPGFDENTKLAVIGSYQEPDYYEEHFAFTNDLTGIKGFLPDVYSANFFLEYYLGFPTPFASAEEIENIKESVQFQEMAVYPYYGSLQRIADVLVVKLS